MAKTTAERAAAHRARQQEKLARLARLEAALTNIIALTEGRPGPVATAIRAAAEEGLKA